MTEVSIKHYAEQGVIVFKCVLKVLLFLILKSVYIPQRTSYILMSDKLQFFTVYTLSLSTSFGA